MGFQKQVNIYPAPGSLGDRADNNPLSVVASGQGSFVAGALGLTIAKFAWQNFTVATGLAVLNNFSPTAPTLPDGFVPNEQQGHITTWLADHGMAIYPGYPCFICDRGDFWAQDPYNEAVIGQKVFANLFSGDILSAATGAFPTNSFGSASAFSASITGYIMTVTSQASGTLAIGQMISGAGVPFPTYIESLGGGTGGTGTYNLSQSVAATVATVSMTSQTPAGLGGCIASNVSVAIATAIMTVNTVTSGSIAVGQMVQAIAGIPANAYISGLGSGTGGTGTYALSTNASATVTAAACNFSSWIETPWYVKSPGNVGDLIKIGVKN
jgi:hypothetical protein